MKVKHTDIDATGTPDTTTFLRGDGSWQIPAGSGSGGILPVVDGSIPPTFIQAPDGSLVYTEIE